MVSLVPKEELYVCEPSPVFMANNTNEGATDPGNPYWTNKNWCKSRFHFNFMDYTTGKSNFGALRLLNDNVVQPKRGFGMHPHNDMEIVTYIVSGEITHTDSKGISETLGRGSVHCMTAGSGMEHAEFNDSATKPVRLFMLWVEPHKSGLEPGYSSCRSHGSEERKDKWLHIVSPVESPADARAHVNGDANVFVTELSAAGSKIDMSLVKGRQAYIVAAEGSVILTTGDGSAARLNQEDAAEVVSDDTDGTLSFTAQDGPAHIMVVEMKQA